MKPYALQAAVRWSVDGRGPKGSLSKRAVSQKTKLPGSMDSRRPESTPLALVAAAHASTFSLTLAEELGAAGSTARQIDTTATITMERITERWTMTQIHLEVLAEVPGVTEYDFVDAALRAKANCPLSRALNANISMSAKLRRPEMAPRSRARRGPELGSKPRPRSTRRRGSTAGGRQRFF